MPKKPPRRNMRAAERERFIVDEAVRFFAEHGFGGQTREFAKRMGITHSAIYRHFPSKEALIERVYEADLSQPVVALMERPLPRPEPAAAGAADAVLSGVCRAGVRVQLGQDIRLLRYEVL